jgi:ferredoxin-NADP reductase
LVFIAGGTGIAPLRAMLHQALGRVHHQPVVVYSARTPGDFAYANELVALAAAGRIELRRTITRDAAGEPWSGNQGRLAAADLAPLASDPSSLYFLCGPPSFVVGTRMLLESCGVARECVRTEEWLAPAPSAPVSA